MIYAYFTSNNNHLINSLKRYFHFLLSYEFNDIKNISYTVDNLFIFEDEKNIDSIIDLVQNMEIKKVYILGYNKISKPNYINLMDLTKLGKTFQDTMVSKESNKNLFGLIYITAFKEKLNLFFKGHGEESLFEVLNWSRYYLSNGPLLYRQNEITHNEYEHKFLSPGLSYWQNFNNRFNKYKIYLILLGYNNKINEIVELILQFDSYLTQLKNLKVSEIKAVNENLINKNFAFLKKIDEILSTISRSLRIGDFYVQNSSSR